MPNKPAAKPQNPLASIPKTDRLLAREALQAVPLKLRTKLVREALESLRETMLKAAETSAASPLDEAALENQILDRFKTLTEPSLKPLINATGVVAHTNLGRSPIDPALLAEIEPILSGYSNLEYDLETGGRGSRYDRLEKLLGFALGAEAALAVNNNAAAVFLILNTFAAGKEAIVSRGELVEIGGSFRIPEVMRQSGAILREVGATNRTRLSDYEEAISEQTAVLMKAHRSNFAMTGFVGEVAFADLIELAQKRGLIDYYDIGAGQFAPIGFGSEPLLGEIAALKPSLASFSGDKLFGGAQAGVIFGKKRLVDRLKKNQLLRMLRVDKFTIAVLEATLRRYLLEREDEIPTIAMLRSDLPTLAKRAAKLREMIAPAECAVVETKNYAGGGSLPEEAIGGVALFVAGDPDFLRAELRKRKVAARTENDRLLIEMRTVFDRDLGRLSEAILGAIEAMKTRGATGKKSARGKAK